MTAVVEEIACHGFSLFLNGSMDDSNKSQAFCQLVIDSIFCTLPIISFSFNEVLEFLVLAKYVYASQNAESANTH